MVSLSRREAVVAAASGLAWVSAGRAQAVDAPVAPAKAWHQADGTEVVVRFTVPETFAVPREGDVVFSSEAAGLDRDGRRKVFEVWMSVRARVRFQRIGVPDLATHFRGKEVTVRGKVLLALPTDPWVDRKTLDIDSLDQFVSVRS